MGGVWFSLPLVVFLMTIVGIGGYLVGYCVASKRSSDER